MRVRRETIEHPFAALRIRVRATHFPMKTLPKVTRVMNIVGIKPLLAASGA